MISNAFRRLTIQPEATAALKAFYGSSSSNIWLERQRKDPYVKRAVKESYRARSAFKLIEINDKFKFLKPGISLIDVGAAPGSWSQVAVAKTNSNGAISSLPKGLVISIDLENIEELPGTHVLPFSDITHKSTQDKIEKILNGRKLNCVLSDMAPNATGESTLDHDRIISLQTCVFDIAKRLLKPSGHFLCKIWMGDSVKSFQELLKTRFEQVRIVKPPSSRADSAEVFLFCSNFKSLSSASPSSSQ